MSAEACEDGPCPLQLTHTALSTNMTYVAISGLLVQRTSPQRRYATSSRRPEYPVPFESTTKHESIPWDVCGFHCAGEIAEEITESVPETNHYARTPHSELQRGRPCNAGTSWAFSRHINSMRKPIIAVLRRAGAVREEGNEQLAAAQRPIPRCSRQKNVPEQTEGVEFQVY